MSLYSVFMYTLYTVYKIALQAHEYETGKQRSANQYQSESLTA
ncbi:hypothetical protein G2583_4116 [Escherichia coli O55:H7 str. CB9615]|uniref:Uncharacterized protein n=1 Tax=Escherichia coli O157:H7 TaxID=83334 RepID=Q8X3N7_ECO57|nr:hypothetical protein Z4775 [Escherichia coli O157:H7 str. EDL933]ADD58589.1 hypothetical protein G2583_4116 [Escherichia coli O55:H7 str. CB9615]